MRSTSSGCTTTACPVPRGWAPRSSRREVSPRRTAWTGYARGGSSRRRTWPNGSGGSRTCSAGTSLSPRSGSRPRRSTAPPGCSRRCRHWWGGTGIWWTASSVRTSDSRGCGPSRAPSASSTCVMGRWTSWSRGSRRATTRRSRPAASSACRPGSASASGWTPPCSRRGSSEWLRPWRSEGRAPSAARRTRPGARCGWNARARRQPAAARPAPRPGTGSRPLSTPPAALLGRGGVAPRWHCPWELRVRDQRELARERLEERHERIHLLLAEAALELHPAHDGHRLVQRRGAAVVEVRRGERHVAQRRDTEHVAVLLPARHRSAADVLRPRDVRERRIPVPSEQHAVVAADAARFLEDLEPALLQRGERCGVPLEVAVERRARRDQRPLERSNRLRDVVEGERVLLVGERRPEKRLVPGLTQPLHRLFGREVHLHVRLDRPLGLLLQRRRPAVPELRGEERRIEDGRAVPRALAGALADRHRARIHAGRADHVTGVARNDARTRELRLEEQLVPEINALRRARVVRRMLRRRGKRLEERRHVGRTRTLERDRPVGVRRPGAAAGRGDQHERETEEHEGPAPVTGCCRRAHPTPRRIRLPQHCHDGTPPCRFSIYRYSAICSSAAAPRMDRATGKQLNSRDGPINRESADAGRENDYNGVPGRKRRAARPGQPGEPLAGHGPDWPAQRGDGSTGKPWRAAPGCRRRAPRARSTASSRSSGDR